MAFDLKQCEADGWKCEVTTADGQRSEVCEYRGVHRSGRLIVVWPRSNESLAEPDEVRNIPPKVKRWLYGHAPYSEALDKAVDVRIPLIEDSTGIRVDHSDAVIAALEGLNGKMPYFEGAAIVTSVILNAIAKIKKDRGE
jgi:hypothetical protein